MRHSAQGAHALDDTACVCVVSQTQFTHFLVYLYHFARIHCLKKKGVRRSVTRSLTHESVTRGGGGDVPSPASSRAAVSALESRGATFVDSLLRGILNSRRHCTLSSSDASATSCPPNDAYGPTVSTRRFVAIHGPASRRNPSSSVPLTCILLYLPRSLAAQCGRDSLLPNTVPCRGPCSRCPCARCCRSTLKLPRPSGRQRSIQESSK
jgi:hypothetical protein